MPIDRGAIDAQLRDIGESDRWWEQREFRDLPHILHADERIRGIVRGKLLGSRIPKLRPTSPWLLVATDQRLICLKQDRLARRQVEVPAGQIAAARTGTRLRSFQIVLETPYRSYRLRIGREDAFRFTRALEPLMPKARVQWLDGAPAPAGTGVRSLPGVGRVAALLAGPPAADAPARERAERLEGTVERLQADVERLQQQVAFLEDLLRVRAEGGIVPAASGRPADSTLHARG